MRLIPFVLSVGLVLGIVGCRASFQDIQKKGLLSSGDDLGAKDDNSSKASPNPNPDFPILENIKELPPEDSVSYGCDGTVVIYEKGKDKNRDGVLQPTEVTDIKTECKLKTPGGKDPEKPGNPPPKCPNQSKDPKASCPDDPDQNDPDQNDPSQSGKN